MVKNVVYWPLVRLLIILLLCPVTLYGCGGDTDDHLPCDCDDEMATYLAIYGEPEEIHRYDNYDADHYIRTWWYWSQGFYVTFEWYTHFHVDDGECCEVWEHAL